MLSTFAIYCAILINISLVSTELEFCDSTQNKCDLENNKNTKTRYLFYDINPPEGFNLRRDVYMRFAIFVHNLRQSNKKNLNTFKLILPPWPNLYHWGSNERLQIPWSHFFDLTSLQRFAPVIEIHEFFNDVGMLYSKIKIDEVYILQHFEEMFKSGKFVDKMEVEACNKKVETSFYHYDNITSSNIKCLSFHGHATRLSAILEASKSRTVFFYHAEVALHDNFGDTLYWKARRSMRFNKELQKIATEFRLVNLNSTDEADNTEFPEDWRNEKPHRTAKGGNYLGVHLRRRDFEWGRPNDVPSLKNSAKQIETLLNKLNLTTVFIATDAPAKEFEEFQQFLVSEFRILKYTPDNAVKEKIYEGGIAIIEQIICSHAKYFVGTHESTFSFRIQEEREIMGFPPDTTFNRLCGNNQKENCEKPSMWKIVY